MSINEERGNLACPRWPRGLGENMGSQSGLFQETGSLYDTTLLVWKSLLVLPDSMLSPTLGLHTEIRSDDEQSLWLKQVPNPAALAPQAGEPHCTVMHTVP